MHVPCSFFGVHFGVKGVTNLTRLEKKSNMHKATDRCHRLGQKRAVAWRMEKFAAAKPSEQVEL